MSDLLTPTSLHPTVFHELFDVAFKDPLKRERTIGFALEYLENTVRASTGHDTKSSLDYPVRTILGYLEETNDPRYPRFANLFRRAVAQRGLLAPPPEDCAHLRTPKGLCVSCGATA